MGTTISNLIFLFIRSNPILISTFFALSILPILLPNFATSGNFNSILYEVSLGFVASIGLTYLLVMGEIDLSIGAVYGFAGTLCGFLLLSGLPIAVCMMVGILASMVAGLANGIMVVQFKLNSLLVTIGTLTLLQGLIGVLTNEMGGSIYPEEFRSIAHYKFFGWPWLIWIAFIILILLSWAELKIALFRKIYFVGENRNSALLYGIREQSLRLIGFLVSSIFAGATGVVAAARGARGDITLGSGLEFNLLVAAVVGGVSLFGGRGRIIHTYSGLLFVNILLTCLIMFNIEPLFQQCVVGMLLLVAVAIDRILNPVKESKSI